MSQPLGERLALDELHDQEVLATGFFHAEERSDVRMIQRGEDFGFALEARDAVGVGEEGFGQNFNGDAAPELHVARAVHLAHAARAEQAENLVRPEAASWV